MLRMLKRLLTGRRGPSRGDLSDIFKAKYERFKELLDSNSELSKIITDIEEKLQGHTTFGMSYVRSQSARAVFHTMRMIQSLNALSGQKYPQLPEVLDRMNATIKESISQRRETPVSEWILPYERINKDMVDYVGGKNANLGEVLNEVNLPIPEGFAITTEACNYFLKSNDLVDEINRLKMEIDPDQPETVNQVSESIQRLIIMAPMPEALQGAILEAYDAMAGRMREKAPDQAHPRYLSAAALSARTVSCPMPDSIFQCSMSRGTSSFARTTTSLPASTHREPSRIG